MNGDGFFDGFLWAMVSLGTLGVFIDFLLGKPGQKKVKDFLETWWLIFNNLKWRALGRTEANLVASYLDSKFSLLIISRGVRRHTQRPVRNALLIVAGMHVAVAISMFSSWALGHCAFDWSDFRGTAYTVVSVLITMLGLLGSIWFTVYVARLVSRISPNGWILAVTTAVVLCVHVAMFLFMTPALGKMKEVMTETYVAVLERWEFKTSFTPDSFVKWDDISPGIRVVRTAARILVPGIKNEACSIGAQTTLPFSLTDILVSVLRMLFMSVFVLSFLFRPLVQLPLSLIWLRVLESDKPMATYVFGGIATGAKLIQEGIKQFA